MSRIGKQPVLLPAGVQVQKAADGTVTVKGPKGSLSRQFHPRMILDVVDSQVLVQRPNDDKEFRALHGLSRSLLLVNAPCEPIVAESKRNDFALAA
jgi:large subunit ribosomal protein L6